MRASATVISHHFAGRRDDARTRIPFLCGTVLAHKQQLFDMGRRVMLMCQSVDDVYGTSNNVDDIFIKDTPHPYPNCFGLVGCCPKR